MEISAGETEAVCIAHVRQKDGQVQSVEQHLQKVCELTGNFADRFGMGRSGRLIGLLHDVGKYSQEFQEYIRGVTGLAGEEQKVLQEAKKGTVDHATAGAQVIWRNVVEIPDRARCAMQILANCVSSHHTGLQDYVTLEGSSVFLRRMEKDESLTHCTEACNAAPKSIAQGIEALLDWAALEGELKPHLALMRRQPSQTVQCLHLALLNRMLFSCLIDADRSDTADFENEAASRFRSAQSVDWAALVDKLERHLEGFTSAPGDDRKPSAQNVNAVREQVSQYCQHAAERPKGAYTLTVPTGGGKTLASLRFALHHALRRSSSSIEPPVERIIYVLPFTTIIEQNADCIRKILGDENVLEHHCNVVDEGEGDDSGNGHSWRSWRRRVLSENWDAPVVLTTSVQLLNALYANPTRCARRMHRLANSVLIFDEIQSLPIKTIHLFNNAINFLVEHCGATVLLCTATQPLLERVSSEHGALQLSDNAPIVPEALQLHVALRRTAVQDRRKVGGWTLEESAALAVDCSHKYESLLYIVNTKKTAQDLFAHIRTLDPHLKAFHLSTNMCPAHRKKVLDEIRNLVIEGSGQRIVCVSTQLIEAGVDIDMGCVIRHMAGLDSIAQAAGRCNRHGLRKEPGPVLVLNSAFEQLCKLPEIQKAQEITERILDEYAHDPDSLENDLFSSEAMRRYYKYYFFERRGEMVYQVSPGGKSKISVHDNLVNLLSLNSNGVAAYKRIMRQALPIRLTQALQTAARSFQVINAPTQGILVPFGPEGRNLIAELCAVCTYAETSLPDLVKLLKRAQKYMVNVFPHDLKKLSQLGAIYEAQPCLGVFCLRESHYNIEYGVTLDESESLGFQNV